MGMLLHVTLPSLMAISGIGSILPKIRRYAVEANRIRPFHIEPHPNCVPMRAHYLGATRPGRRIATVHFEAAT